jgi:hypothetical protein
LEKKPRGSSSSSKGEGEEDEGEEKGEEVFAFMKASIDQDGD